MTGGATLCRSRIAVKNRCRQGMGRAGQESVVKNRWWIGSYPGILGDGAICPSRTLRRRTSLGQAFLKVGISLVKKTKGLNLEEWGLWGNRVGIHPSAVA